MLKSLKQLLLPSRLGDLDEAIEVGPIPVSDAETPTGQELGQKLPPFPCERSLLIG